MGEADEWHHILGGQQSVPQMQKDVAEKCLTTLRAVFGSVEFRAGLAIHKN